MKRSVQSCGLIFVFTVICSCSKPAVDTGFDWPQWRGPDGNGQSRETEWDPASIAAPRLLWKADVDFGYSNVVIQDGRLYTTGMASEGFVVSCFDAGNGRRIWRHPLMITSFPPQATPCVDDDTVYVLSYEGLLSAIDARNGRERWRKDLVADFGAIQPFYGFAGSPVIADDLIIMTANSAGIAVDPETGDLVWVSDPPPGDFPTTLRATDTGTRYSTPVFFYSGGEKLAVVSGWEGLSAVKVRTGERMWLYPCGPLGCNETCDPVIVEDGRILAFAFGDIPFGEAVLFHPSPRGPEVLWHTNYWIYNLISTPVVVDGRLYGSDADATLHCIDLETGLEIGKPEPATIGSTDCLSLTAADGTLIMLSSSGFLRISETAPDGYKEIAQCDVLEGASRPRKFWTPPVLCNAKIYCRNFAGDLVCIDVSK